MIKNNQRVLNIFHVILDALTIILSYVLAFMLQFYVFGKSMAPYTPQRYFQMLVYVVPLYLMFNWVFHLYTPKRVMGRRLEASNVLKANILGVFVIIAYLYLGHEEHFSRSMLFYYTVINTVLLIAERLALRFVLYRMRRSGMNQKHIVILGYSRAAESFIDRVKINPQWGYQLRGILDDNKEWGYTYKGVNVIGKLSALEELLELNRLDEIVIALNLKDFDKLGSLVAICEKSGVHTKFIPDYNYIIPTKPYTEDLLGLPVIHIRYVPLTDMFNRFVKRAMDIVGAMCLILMFSPVMIVVAILIKITSPGPLIYKQERVGLHNRPFMMYKFRSMKVQAPSEEKSKWTTKGDPRVTKIGKFIRATSIDELPQFFNVLKGDMSLVGPRPERPFFVEKFKEEIPRYMVKHQVRPGITGWAQVNGYRGDTSILLRVEHDLYYIEHWTFGFDIKILFLTIFKGFVNKNAY